MIRPILRGRDITRYSYHWANLWLIATFPSRHYDIEQYPAVKNYLLSFGMERLEQTGKEHIINGERIKARKKTNNQWFETQDSISYWGDFLKPKVVYQELTQGSCFYYDEKAEYFILQTAYFISGSDLPYLIKLLNSKFIEYCFSKFYSTSMGRTGFRWLSQYVERLPIALYKDTEIQRQIVLCKQTDDKQINNLIYQMYGLTAEEIEKIEQS